MELSETEKRVLVQALLLVPTDKLIRVSGLNQSETSNMVLRLVGKVNNSD